LEAHERERESLARRKRGGGGGEKDGLHRKENKNLRKGRKAISPVKSEIKKTFDIAKKETKVISRPTEKGKALSISH